MRKYLLRVQINGEERQFSFDSILKVQKFMMRKGYSTPKKNKYRVFLYQQIGRLL